MRVVFPISTFQHSETLNSLEKTTISQIEILQKWQNMSFLHIYWMIKAYVAGTRDTSASQTHTQTSIAQSISQGLTASIMKMARVLAAL